MSLKEKSLAKGAPIQQKYADGSMIRFGRLEQLDRQFDLDYWQSRTAEERFEAAWQLVVDYHVRKGGHADELRLQRSVGKFGRFPS